MNYQAKRKLAADRISKNGKLLTLRYPGAALEYWVYTYDPILGDTWTLTVPESVIITLSSLEDFGTSGQYGRYNGELYQNVTLGDLVLDGTWTLNGDEYLDGRLDAWLKCTLVMHTNPNVVPLDYAVYGVELSYTDKDYDGERIKIGDRKFMVSALSTSGIEIPKPNVGGTLFVGTSAGTALTIVTVEPFMPGDMVIYYMIQARG